jgi:hypothetical protein
VPPPLTNDFRCARFATIMRSYHLTFASVGRHPLFPTESARRAAVRALGRVAGAWIVLFALVDDHVHVVVFCEAGRVGRLARAILLALRPLAAVEIRPAHVVPVRDRSHMASLVPYLLTQPIHHGLSEHPALTTGSCWPDLVGARRIPALTLPLLNALPRFRLRDAYRHVGLPAVELQPAADDVLRALGAVRLVAAASRAHGVGPTLARNEPAAAEVRTVAVQLAAAAGMHVSEVAHALAIGTDAARKIGARAPDPRAHRAVRLAIALEGAAHALPRASQATSASA